MRMNAKYLIRVRVCIFEIFIRQHTRISREREMLEQSNITLTSISDKQKY